MPESNNFQKIPDALPYDYTELQGGYPSVSKQGKLFVVEHNYLPEGERMKATSSRNPDNSEKVVYQVSSGMKQFLADLLWRHHGQPCEERTIRNGGRGSYERR